MYTVQYLNVNLSGNRPRKIYHSRQLLIHTANIAHDTTGAFALFKFEG